MRLSTCFLILAQTTSPVFAQDAPPLNGVVQGIGASGVTIKLDDGSTQTIVLDGAVINYQQPGTVSDIAIGDRALAFLEGDSAAVIVKSITYSHNDAKLGFTLEAFAKDRDHPTMVMGKVTGLNPNNDGAVLAVTFHALTDPKTGECAGLGTPDDTRIKWCEGSVEIKVTSAAKINHIVHPAASFLKPGMKLSVTLARRTLLGPLPTAISIAPEDQEK